MKSKPRLRLELPTWKNFTICGAVPDEGEEPGKEAGTGSAGDDKTRDPEARITALQEERDRHYRERQAAEAKTSEQETELNELRSKQKESDDAKLSAEQKVAKDLEAERGAKKSLVEANRRLAIQNAFLLHNSVSWHNPADALALADLSKLEVEDDGTIKNPDILKEVITQLAKDKAYLVKTDAPPEKDQKKPPPGSGSPTNGVPPKTDGLDADTLRNRYPALRSH